MEKPPKRLKILLSAYACEPNRGSEPGVGWEWASRMAKWHDVTVLTRSNNREAIQTAYSNGEYDSRAEFVFHDLPRWVLKLKRKGIFPIHVYYLVWQFTAKNVIKKSRIKYDIIHHVTFNGFRFPGAWWSKDLKVVLGPLGGGSITAPQFRPCYGSGWILEKAREYSIRLWQWTPWTVASLKNASKVLVVGEELRNRFREAGTQPDMMLETALPLDLEERRPSIPPNEKKDFLWVGNLEPWKAWQIALEAFSLAIAEGLGDCRMRIIGKGHQEGLAKSAALRLGIADRIDFMGQKPRDEVWRMMARARALIFSSVRDTSGNVVLEAMGLNCPVVCFEHQGAAMMTDSRCAIVVKPGTWQKSVRGFADAMRSLNGNDELVGQLGNAGRERALSKFSWNAKIEEMCKIYNQVYEG